MDLLVVNKAGKKHWVISIVGVIIPHTIMYIVTLIIRKYIDNPMLHKQSSFAAITSTMIVSSFPTLYTILRDMQLLRSEIGLTILTTATLIELVGISHIVSFEAMMQAEAGRIYVLYYMLTNLLVSGLLLYVVPQVMLWINNRTPKFKLVEQNYIVAILLGVFVFGFITDLFGSSIGVGSFILGLVIPDGPLIGETIINHTEVITNDIFMPFAYATLGLTMDVFAIFKCWSCLIPILTLAVLPIIAKFATIVMSARFMEMSYTDSLIIGFIFNVKGQTEFFLFLHYMDYKILDTSSFSLMMTLVIIVTSITCPIVNYLYDPTKPYMINKKRTIQHTVDVSKLRLMACIYDQESVTSLFSLLDFVNPTTNNPFTIFVIHLIELLGRATPMYIDHMKEIDEYWDNNNVAVHKAIKLYEKDRMNCITMNLFTSVTPNQTMYQDICENAYLNKVRFIILPFHKKCIKDGNNLSTATLRPGVQYTNTNTLTHAPCSVGILACKDAATWEIFPSRLNQCTRRQFVLLFLGGPDAREALALASHMVEHPDVSLIVVRFLSNEQIGDIKSERKMDDGVITWFWVKNEKNEKVVYREVVVNNGFETITTIQLLNSSASIDLWILGRGNGINPTLLEGLSEWSENPDLGLIGDFLVSADFNTLGSVLVVQQQVLRNERVSSLACN
ncbi:cation/H(+) antiporter 24-like [Chenopodium quinoa]|nr:cation/H(+) antiporter 24-like [Chenopodium quinoa]